MINFLPLNQVSSQFKKIRDNDRHTLKEIQRKAGDNLRGQDVS